MRLTKLFLVSLAALSASGTIISGCAYRSDLNQGNFVEQSAVNQLAYGMNQDQVRYLLGTPMLLDPFDHSRWYFIKFSRKGWSDPEIKRLVLLFDGNTLIDMSGDFKKPASFENGLPKIKAPANDPLIDGVAEDEK